MNNKKMESKNLIKGVDKSVSKLVLGTAWYSLKDRGQWFDLMDEFVRCGGTTIDTGRIYGESEDVIGQWMEMRANRDRIVVITKGGHSKDDPGRLSTEVAKKVEEDITKSLEHLRTDYIDMYFLHRDNPLVPVSEIVNCLNAEMERGRIHSFGGSNWEPHRIDEANEYAHKHNLVGFAAVQNNLSLAVPAGSFYPGLVSVDKKDELWHIKNGIPLFSWSSQARGFFTGRFTPEMRENADKIQDDFLARMIKVYCTNENFERLRRAKELGEKKGGYSTMEIALAWVINKPFDIVPIIGTHTKEELASCVSALSIKLTEEEIKWLNLE